MKIPTYSRKARQNVRLGVYEEAIGRFRGLRKDKGYLQVIFESFSVAIPVYSSEADNLLRMSEDLVGQRVAVLRTDLLDRPVLMRIVEDIKDSDKGGD